MSAALSQERMPMADEPLKHSFKMSDEFPTVPEHVTPACGGVDIDTLYDGPIALPNGERGWAGQVRVHHGGKGSGGLIERFNVEHEDVGSCHEFHGKLADHWHNKTFRGVADPILPNAKYDSKRCMND
jgi:hypothetical protein